MYPITHQKLTDTFLQDKVSTMTLDKAQRLAKKQDLKLVKIEDPSLKKNSNVYKLLTGKQYFEEQMKKKGDKKSSVGVKVLVLLTSTSYKEFRLRW